MLLSDNKGTNLLEEIETDSIKTIRGDSAQIVPFRPIHFLLKLLSITSTFRQKNLKDQILHRE